MIQYNNFLMKREQSRAGSRFAECEKSRLKAKILITLALLLTAVTGAWAQTVTVKELTASEITAWANDATNITAADLPGFVEATTEQAQSWDGYPTNGFAYLIYGFDNGEIKKIMYNSGNAMTPSQNPKTRGGVYDDMNRSTPDRYFYVTGIEGGIEVNPVEGKTNEWTFSMPGSDVVLTPQYAPAAQLDKDGAPAAVSGLEIAADAAIITAGQSAQGTLLYAVTTSAEEKPALTAFSATLPNAKDQTAAGNYYVWYYIQGQDTPQGQEPSADNTFNDSEIMGPLTVELLTNEHTLNIKQSPNITVTVAGTAKTPTDDKVTPVTTGQEVKIKANTGYKFRKVEVKKKEAAASLIVNPAVGQVIGSDGKNYDADALLPTGVTAVAVIAYVGSDTGDDTYKNGLAIALADEGSLKWSTAKSTCEGKTAITGAKWCLPSQDQWKQMFKANGGNEGSYNGLNTTITTAGGTTLQEDAYYWSSSELSPGVYAYYVYLYYGNAYWSNGDEDFDVQVRACLAF